MSMNAKLGGLGEREREATVDNYLSACLSVIPGPDTEAPAHPLVTLELRMGLFDPGATAICAFL